MKLLNRKITFAAGKLDRTIHFSPDIHIHARRSGIGWYDWAFEVAFLLWAVGFKVELIENG